MRPDVSEDMKVGWISIALVAVVSLIILLYFSDSGKSATKLAKEKRTYESNKGDSDFLLIDQIQEQTRENLNLLANITDLKNAVGIKPIRPFALPPNAKIQKNYYHRQVYDIAREYLNRRARNMRINEYDDAMGFKFPDGELVPEERAPEELIRLQLTVRAMLLALSTPDRLQEITIKHHPIVETGPVKRPPLLREYPFTIRVRGSLKDILWLLHQYSADEVQETTLKDWNKLVTHFQRELGRNIKATSARDHFPLILIGMKIDSENSEPLDSVEQLEAEFELAGMEFLSDEERDNAKSNGVRGTRGGRGAGTGRF